MNKKTYSAPIIINLFEGYRVEDNAGHKLGQNTAVLDEVLVVWSWSLVNDTDDPLQHFVLQLNVPLQYNKRFH